jgi:hypothetical protein
MQREVVIRLIEEECHDGSIYVSSPEVSLLHVVLKPGEHLEEIVLPILAEMIERKTGTKPTLRAVDVLDTVDGANERPSHIPAHVIAQMVA